jgi:hypothetical protein
MKSMTMYAAVLALATWSAGCKEDDHGHNPDGSHPKPPATATTTAPAEHVPGDAATHQHIPIGVARMGDLMLTATTDGAVKAGGEGAFDVTIMGAKPKAVRFWVGGELGDGSVKAKADEETPGVWHTHVEIPDPLPAGSQFWVEVEPATGEKAKASFKLITQ